MPKSEVFCMDCMEALKTLPDNAFDLAVVDPPYGDALEHTHTHTRAVEVPRWEQKSERPVEQISEAVARTGGTWATKYGKKLWRGT